MDAFFWDVFGSTYDREENLFYRDAKFRSKRTANDKKVLWSRENGWAFGSLTRILKVLPKDHGSYAKYKALFVKMAESLAQRQQSRWLLEIQPCRSRRIQHARKQWHRLFHL